jgi:hypothetical protein
MDWAVDNVESSADIKRHDMAPPYAPMASEAPSDDTDGVGEIDCREEIHTTPGQDCP